MTTAAEGRELTQVGPGTAMGELMRQYWIPAAQSSELERDGAPVRLMLLGEKLIAFRDSAGRVGVMDHRCPHRCASLFLGRNEEGGIRCIYHGWKFDVAGNCVDMPSVPPHQDFKHKVKAKAYRARRARRAWSGSIWARAPRRRRCRRSKSSTFPTTKSASASSSANATTCRRSRARSTPRISASCTPATSIPDDVAEDDPVHHTVTNRAPEYHDRRCRLGHAVRRLPPGRRRTAPIGASPTSCFRSGPRRPTASSAATCMRAPGCRSTTATRCSASCGGSAGYRR